MFVCVICCFKFFQKTVMDNTTDWMDPIVQSVDEFLRDNDNSVEEKTLDVNLTNNSVVALLKLKLPLKKNKRWIDFEDDTETAKRIRVPVLMITNIEINNAVRKQGHFTRLIDRLYSLVWGKYKRVIYLECIIQQDWFDHLYNTSLWYKLVNKYDSLLYIPNLSEVKNYL